MEKVFITHSGNPRLILLFLGWGMDSTPFASLHKPGYDLLALSDYSSDSPEAFADLIPLLDGYREVVVVAWSFGVRIATSFLALYRDSCLITKAIAVNGTTAHIHDSQGIPGGIFSGTLANLSEASVRKFRRRMFSSAGAFQAFIDSAPQRSFASLESELQAFGSLRPLDPDCYALLWDLALISAEDRIFPAANQAEAWRSVPSVVLPSAPHFPDFAAIFDRHIINKQLVAARFASASATYAKHADVQTDVARKLWDLTANRLSARGLSPSRILEIGVGSGTLTSLYAPAMAGCHIDLWDIAPVSPSCALPAGASFHTCDAEVAVTSLPAGSVDLLLSASTIQWFHSPSRFVSALGRVLAPGGIAALAFYGPGTFSEIEAATGRSLSYPSPDVMVRAAERSGLTVTDCLSESLRMDFPDVRAALKHLKYTGVNALSDDDAAARSAAIKLMRSFPVQPDGSTALTYNPVYLILANDII